MEDVYFDYKGGSDVHFKVDVLASDGATSLFQSEDGVDRTFMYETDNYKTVSSSVIFGALKNGDSLSLKPYLMSEIVSFFLYEDSTNAIKPVFEENNNVAVYPNPFQDEISIAFTLDETSNVRLIIYSLDGQIIKTLANQALSKGEHTLNWSGRNNSGTYVTKGIYFIQLKIGNQILHKKLVYTN